MQLVFNDSVKTKEDVKKIIKDKNISLPQYKLAVISILEDKNHRLLLQRRGPKSRDEYYKLAEIGGAVEETDTNFISAIKREIKEEVGDEIQYSIDYFVGAFLENKYDSRSNSNVNWLFLVYKGTYLGGELKNAEEKKSLSYEFYKYEELPIEQLSTSTKFFTDYYHKNKRLLM